MFTLRRGSCVLLGAMVLAGAAAAPARTSHPLPWNGAQQMVVVVIDAWDANRGTLHTFNRVASGWKDQGTTTPVTIGRTGAAWGMGISPPQQTGPQKIEGDGRSPAGVFRIGTAFGYAEDYPTALPWRGLTASDYCVDVSGSPYYNQLVDTKNVGAKAVEGSTEAMRRDLHFHGDQAYRVGFVIEHNAKGATGKGSCIFAHVWKSPTSPTAGCTAMPDTMMEHLLAWLDPKKKPVFVLLPKDEYARLRSTWQLPAL
ncbi:L,D-peptidoglycan transpeptidase YkuD (ErfK/YbiS/YcfS/YnhG family) [Luteibacter sp. Sphag1AF]|uniref:L,D-transpeptidase family protein n=1 Tax=Luteibacter sp. Sphag1AF TaxID=2587031 RepID=UPI0016100CF8|nr:L,D-transpeptidase family protein [Luteibacter sp. Sphag1AF]MBB3227591.1 L,D-peptidoglycan transpeptidase YkuD (ErfK/YbiS/YcfS/YnhG family) [Luteibacter sp. Sphag1AF]